jgi:nucleotide-binding universal stress UspA family protein
MKLTIDLAYDGSINADWVARYAFNMAANGQDLQIILIHILDHIYSPDKIAKKIEAVEAECAVLGVRMTSRILPLQKNVFYSLLQTIPAGEGSLCVCGARISSRNKGFLAGTISEKLLRRKQFKVMAIRVVKPGILGAPKELLFPLSGHPKGFQAAMSFFLLLAPEVERLHLLRIMKVSSLWFQYMPVTIARSLQTKGFSYVNEVLKEIRQQLGENNIYLDAKVILSDDWVKEILIHASKTHAQMILMGASDRNLPSRYFYGNKIEQILRRSPCDVGIYRKI